MLSKKLIFIFAAFIIERSLASSSADYNITELLKAISFPDVTRFKVSNPQQFRYLPVEKRGCFNFWVKTDNEAQVSLSNSAQYNNPLIRIIIGGWKNGASAIILNDDFDNLAIKVDTPNLLDKNEFVGFWVRWSTFGDILVGKINEPLPFLVYTYTKLWFPINFVGLANYHYGYATGEFIIDHVCVGVGVDIYVHGHKAGIFILIGSVLVLFFEIKWVITLFVQLLFASDNYLSGCILCWSICRIAGAWRLSPFYIAFGTALIFWPQNLWLSYVAGTFLLILAVLRLCTIFKFSGNFKGDEGLLPQRDDFFDKSEAGLTDGLDDSFPEVCHSLEDEEPVEEET